MKIIIKCLILLMLCFFSNIEASASSMISAMNGNGTCIVVWQESDSDVGTFTINASIINDSGVGTTQIIGDPSLMESKPILAINSSGNIVMIWTVFDEGNAVNALYMIKYTNSTSSWDTTPTLLSSTNLSILSNFYTVRLSDSNFMVVSWSAYNTITNTNVTNAMWGSFGSELTGAVSYP